jgi:hypothetical protein
MLHAYGMKRKIFSDLSIIFPVKTQIFSGDDMLCPALMLQVPLDCNPDSFCKKSAMSLLLADDNDTS